METLLLLPSDLRCRPADLYSQLGRGTLKQVYLIKSKIELLREKNNTVHIRENTRLHGNKIEEKEKSIN